MKIPYELLKNTGPMAAPPLTDRKKRSRNALEWLALTTLIASLVAIGGCAASGSGLRDGDRQGSAGPTTGHGSGVMEYRIGPADVLSISVWNHREMNQTVTVRPDGQVSFPLVGDIPAVGLTPLELQGAMELALGKYIDVIPGEVSVVVDAVHSYTVSVLGEVRLPGRFEFRNQASVLDALAEAGGLTEFASSSNILILRTTQGRTEKIRFDYKRLLNSESTASRVLVYPGDTILVP